MLDLSFFGGVLFFFAYLWPITLTAPGILERITSKKYRFSILRLIYLLNTLTEKIKIPKYPKLEWTLNRSAPFLIGEVMVLVSGPKNFLYPLLGVVMAWVVLYLRFRFTNFAND